MLVKFSVENYRGFSKKIEWSLNNPSDYDFNQDVIKNGVIKNGIIYGPNGSGKTNFGLAIFDLVHHLTQKEKAKDYLFNFAYAGNVEKPVSFEYVFKLNGHLVKYSYAKKGNGELISEKMETDGVLAFSRNGTLLDIPKYEMESYRYNDLVNNANRVSIVSSLLSTYPLKEDDPILSMQQFAESMLWFKNLEEDRYIGLQNGGADVEEYIIQNGYSTAFSEFLSDISKQRFNFVSSSHERFLWCEINHVKIPFDLLRSTGTRALEFLFYWLTKIDKASLIFIDEFDAFYHYELAFKVCKKLFEYGCQIFMTSHNTYLMTNDLLRPDCNFILNNNLIKPLCDCTDKELRWGHNIEKLYRGGTFD